MRDTGTMGDFDVFANVIVLAPHEIANGIYEQTNPFFDASSRLAAGITRLPNQAGLLYKALGMEPGPVKKMVRDFCSVVRQHVKGRPLPAEFPWR